MRIFVLAFATIAASTAPVLAQDRTLPAGFEDFEVSAFQTMQADVSVATDKKSGHKVNIVKMKNGHVMVMIPWGSYAPIMKGTGPDDMLH